MMTQECRCVQLSDVAGGRAVGPQPLAVSAEQLASLFGLSVRTIRQMDASGRLPRPVRLSRNSVRWVLEEIREWLRAGSPDRGTWEAMRRYGREAA